MPATYEFVHEDSDVRVISQKQNGSIALSDSGRSAIFTAGAKTSVVGKSAFSAAIDPITDEEPKQINVAFDLMIPIGSATNSIIIADFESSVPEISSNPGVRVYLRDGYLRVDRSKIGESDPWYANQQTPITAGEWNAIEINMTPGTNGEGSFEIILNGALVLSETGNNVLSDEWKQSVGLEGLESPVDRIQVGLTSNSNATEAVVELKDLQIKVDDTLILDSFSDLTNAADSFFDDELAELPIFVEPVISTDVGWSASFDDPEDQVSDNDDSTPTQPEDVFVFSASSTQEPELEITGGSNPSTLFKDAKRDFENFEGMAALFENVGIEVSIGEVGEFLFG